MSKYDAPQDCSYGETTDEPRVEVDHIEGLDVHVRVIPRRCPTEEEVCDAIRRAPSDSLARPESVSKAVAYSVIRKVFLRAHVPLTDEDWASCLTPPLREVQWIDDEVPLKHGFLIGAYGNYVWLVTTRTGRGEFRNLPKERVAWVEGWLGPDGELEPDRIENLT